ncbi:MAG: GNAT family N-acetyltransferase [Nakamurella sp.]
MAANVVFEPVSPAAATDPVLRSQLIDVWVAATNAGGAVGFVPPAPLSEIAATLDAAIARVVAGQDSLGILRIGDAAVGMGFLVSNGRLLQAHWRTVLRVMVHPDHQRTGAGRVLMTGLHQQAAELGLEHLMLTIRDGLQLERFYESFGYEVVGRHPGAIRVSPGDDRDEIMLVARL